MALYESTPGRETGLLLSGGIGGECHPTPIGMSYMASTTDEVRRSSTRWRGMFRGAALETRRGSDWLTKSGKGEGGGLIHLTPISMGKGGPPGRT